MSNECEKDLNQTNESPSQVGERETGQDKAPGKRTDENRVNGANGNGNGNGPPPTVEELFFDYIVTRLGFGPDEIIADDDIHRFGEDGDDGSKLPGWYVLHADENDPAPYGSCGDWRTGEKFHWRGQQTRPLTAEEKAAREQRRKEHKNAEEKKQREARKLCAELYRVFSADEVGAHFYLETKNVGAHNIIHVREKNKNLLGVPVCENGEEVVSLQWIDHLGRKLFEQGGKVGGCWFTLARPNDARPSPIVIVEGYATGATIYETTGLPVMVAFNSGNLESVAKNVAKKYPGAEIIIAGDDDAKTERNPKVRRNPGVEDARKAARAVGGVAVFAPFDRTTDDVALSDWNDFAALRGKENVGAIFKAEVEQAKQHPQSDPDPEPKGDGGDVPPPGENDIPPGDGGGDGGPSRGPLPEIQVFAGHLARSVDDAKSALIRANCSVMTRGTQLVMPVWVSYKTANDTETEIVAMKAMTSANLAYILTKHAAIFVRYDGRAKKCVPIDPPERMLTALSHKGQYKLPQVVGVVNCPTLRPDGTILNQPGYDPTTRLWMHPDPNLKLPAIPEHPTKRQAQEALQLFQDLLSGYSLVTDLDRCIAVAAILAVVCRGAFTVGPLYLFNAHTAGEGKSHLVDLISTIIRGRPCPVITMSGNKEEDEKRLGSLLLEAVPIVSLDNCSVDLNGNLLCQIGTQQLVKIRILSKSETPECEWLGTMFCTGNNVNFVDDMVRRGLTANLNSNTEQPELRPFKFDPIEKVLADRGKYIAAALTIARAYFVSGETVECDPLGTYGPSGWSKTVREPLIWLGLPDPWKSTEQTRKDDPFRRTAREFVALWKECLGVDRIYRTNEIIRKANETRQVSVQEGWTKTSEEYAYPELREFLLEIAGDGKGLGINSVRLGKLLSKLQGQIHDKHRVVTAQTDNCRGNRWKLEYVG